MALAPRHHRQIAQSLHKYFFELSLDKHQQFQRGLEILSETLEDNNPRFDVTEFNNIVVNGKH